MSGIVVRLQQRIDIVITAPANGTIVQIPAARRVDCSQFQHGVVIARLHTGTSFVANQTIQFQYAPDPFTDEDPNQNWSGTNATLLTTFTGGTDGAPNSKTGNLVEPFTGLLMFYWFFNFTVATQMKVSLSADLHLKGT